MGGTSTTGNHSLTLDCNLFELSSVTVNHRAIRSTNELSSFIMPHLKPNVASPNLKLIISTERSRLPLDIETLLKLIQSDAKFIISAREHGKLTLVIEYLSEGRYVEEVTMFADPDETVDEIRHKANAIFNVSDTVLYTSTMVLEGMLSLMECGILEDIRLYMMPSSEPTISLTSSCKNLSAWRLLKSGMNLEGICQNSSCPAYSQRVVVPLGFGTFNIAEELLSHHECPICIEVISQFSNLGFYNCSAKFENRKGTSIKADGIECSSHTYTKTKVEKWSSAVVSVTPRKKSSP